jgi:hypothetical protein
MTSLRIRARTIEQYVTDLAEMVVAIATDPKLAIGEGQVRSPKAAAPYRRLDCERRALAYVRARPKKRIVRIDISCLWTLPHESSLRKPSATSVALEVTSEKEAREAAEYLQAIVRHTREVRANRGAA